MSKFIALYSPRAQSGKSQVAKVFDEANYETVKFAAPLKDMVRGLLRSMGINHDTVERMVEGDLKEQVVPGFATVTTRKLMQTLGTDWGREAVDNDLWAKVALQKASSSIKRSENVIIDDLRFPNEYDLLREAGAFLVRVYRPDAPVVGDQRYEGLLESHTFDYQITNDGTLGQLRQKSIDLYHCVEGWHLWPAK